MSITKILLIYSLLVLVSGCNPKSEENKQSNDSNLSPEQIACVQKVFQIQVEQEEKFVSLSVQAMQENKSDIPLQILERRSNEKLCMLELQCYGTQEPMVQGLIFGECLKRMEQESNG